MEEESWINITEPLFSELPGRCGCVVRGQSGRRTDGGRGGGIVGV